MLTRKLSDEEQFISVPFKLLMALSTANSDISGRVPSSEVRVNLNVTVTLWVNISLIGVRTLFPVSGTSLERVIFRSGRVMAHLKLVLWFAMHVRRSCSPGQTDTTLTDCELIPACTGLQ